MTGYRLVETERGWRLELLERGVVREAEPVRGEPTRASIREALVRLKNRGFER